MRRGGSELTAVLIAFILLGAAYYYFIYQPGNALVSVELTLNYADGSTQVITLPTILGGAVINPSTSKAIASIGWAVKATPSWTGNAASLTVTGSNDLYVVVGSTVTYKQGNPISYSTSTGLGTLGQATFTVKTGTLSASTLEGWSTAPGSKILRFMVSCEASMTMAASGSLPSTKFDEATVDLAYTVQPDGITALTVSMTTTIT